MNAVEPEILENAYVKLVPLDASHRAPLHDAVMQTSHELWAYTMKDALADFDGWFKALLELHASRKQHVFVVFDKATGKAVGCSSFMNVETAHDRLEIGSTWYVPAAQGTAINPASKLELMGYAFEKLEIHRLEMKCDARNERSRRAMLKLGAREEGTLRGHMVVPDHHGGTLHRDTVYFSILAPEWPGIKHNLEERLQGTGSPSRPFQRAAGGHTLH